MDSVESVITELFNRIGHLGMFAVEKSNYLSEATFGLKVSDSNEFFTSIKTPERRSALKIYRGERSSEWSEFELTTCLL